MFNVEVVKDSVCGDCRLTTITQKYPRFIHSENLTHRDRARNSASSRAIPWSRMREMVVTQPVKVIGWTLEQKGMSGGDEIPEVLRELADGLWLSGRDSAVSIADKLYNIGDYYKEVTGDGKFEGVKIHKSLVNRIVEPWMWITVVMTATEWKNYYRLRRHKDAEPHFRLLADLTFEAMERSTPTIVDRDGWHLPFVDFDTIVEAAELSQTLNLNSFELLKRVSVARVARVSYLTHDGKRDVAKDLELFDKLVQGSGFGHWSPHEHIARAVGDKSYRSGPFRGWHQYRKDFVTECAD